MNYSPFDKPEGIVTVFAEAWARRDAEKLASLFDEDAEFVNVTGLWWHDREAIRKAHAYGFAHIFTDSTLRVTKVRVKSLTDDIAVVHARVRLEGQTGAAQVDRPGVRNTIFSFVVHRRAGVWSCASAHNTDIVPHMETNLVEPDGTFRPVSYRR
ncbi:SgcJ/EcaC family oxidoreductase [Mesorhizobium denitrificans]|uniref:SgcJ/EcaC family oxidoreductase n=1 Tax=Mesorhizobium denitrificans TaxID=2294114 RepID=A0A371X3N9_9HYPH|nr:SgcJ/EcaC family oxidoreductase [Mesorhizobium denitrificans]RFC63847.1 SgcJ/EcaC family oxidoreductase [Mesorhizobium denitrificans]